MATRKTVSVRDQDERLWDIAERYAERKRMSMSALLMTALEDYLTRTDPNIARLLGERPD